MKVSIGTNVKDGPWGGGNLFAINLTNYLIKNNHEVVYDLNHDDIDIILLTEPRKTSESSAFTHIDVNNYLNYENVTADQKTQTRNLNKYLGLSWEEACLSPDKNKRSVRTASQQQVRKKIYKGSSNAWRKYEPYLNGIFNNLPSS